MERRHRTSSLFVYRSVWWPAFGRAPATCTCKSLQICVQLDLVIINCYAIATTTSCWCEFCSTTQTHEWGNKRSTHRAHHEHVVLSNESHEESFHNVNGFNSIWNAGHIGWVSKTDTHMHTHTRSNAITQRWSAGRSMSTCPHQTYLCRQTLIIIIFICAAFAASTCSLLRLIFLL